MSTELRITRLAGVCLLLYSCLVAAQQSRVTVEVGRKAVLNCDTSGIRYQYDTTWERADGTFLHRGRRFTIKSVKMSDAGVYVCRIRNINDNSEAATSRLQLDVVPANSGGGNGQTQIKISRRSSERLAVGGLLFRSCSVSGGADPSAWKYQWRYPDGRTVASSILYVPNLQQVHFGQYRCTARSATGKVLETEFTFNPRVIVDPGTGGNQLTVQIRRVSIQKPFILECYVEGGSGPYSYEWRKNDQLVVRGQRLVVNTIDATTSGSYECIVRGQGVGGVSMSGRKSDEVQVVMKQSETKISLAPPPGPIHVVEAGRNKELHCELDQSRDEVEVATWYFYPQGSSGISSQARPLQSPQYQIYPTQSVSILVMSKLKVSDSGRYECRVTRDGRDIRREAYVLVVSDVGLEVYPSTLTYTQGKSKQNPEFHCQVDNLPGGADNLRWTFKPSSPRNAPEVSLPSNAKIVRKPGISSTSFLRVIRPTMQNYGHYICRAPGNYEGRGLLIVREQSQPPINLVVKPGQVVDVDPGSTARILCYEWERRVVPEWRFPSTISDQVTQETQSKNRIILIRNVRPDQDGMRIVCHYNNQREVPVTIRVKPGCPPGQRRCRSGSCIRSSLFCNGRVDCPDGSDEDKATCAKCEPNEVECKTNEGRAPAKSCVPVHWICDGENDCGNNFDELRCTVGVGCSKTLFQCQRGRQIQIPRGFRCDGETDCPDNSDEVGCQIPRIVVPSGGIQLRKTVVQGSTVKLKCEAIGIGNPRIVWRYNWGFVTARNQPSDRCIEPNRFISELTLYNVQTRDSGIYTCEALNNQGRAFGEDYVVDVTSL